MRLLRTSHLAPTLLVSAVSFLLARTIWWEGPAYVIAFTVFTGQLVVGWTNDLVDFESDKRENRSDKPLATGEISITTVVRATWIAIVVCVLFSLFGPLGFIGGSVHLLGVGFGVAYNFFFKFTKFSPLPYAIAFAALPSSIMLSKSITPPLWLALSGAGLGIAAHFANVVKDFRRDSLSGLRSLPIVLGIRPSLIISGACFLLVSLNLFYATKLIFLIFVGVIGALLILVLPARMSFRVIMILALTNVLTLVTAGANSIANL